jgi:quercetin dioxygenase-like cupin family protein
MIPDELHARYRSARKIRAEGAIGNLFDGVSITAHGLDTRLLAWPGTGFQTEAVHVTTVKPGQQSDRYAYGLAEEAILCRYGSAEVWLRGQWVTLKPGDIAYIPEGLDRQVRNPATNRADAILVHQICPPQFDLYAEGGYYNNRLGVMNFDAIEKAAINAPWVEPPPPQQMAFNDDQPAIRAQNLAPEDVKARGALFNVLEGAAFTGIGLPMRLVLWPGAGTRLVGFNYAYCGTGVDDVSHKHPVLHRRDRLDRRRGKRRDPGALRRRARPPQLRGSRAVHDGRIRVAAADGSRHSDAVLQGRPLHSSA